MHERIVSESDKYRIEAVPIGVQQGLIDLTEAESGSMVEFSYPFALASFRSHFTIGRTLEPNPSEDEIRALLEDDVFALHGYTLSPDEIIMYNAGVDGSCIEIVERLPLK
ncbi:MAG: hypothetical protein ABIJ92_01700 [Candidatus Aenigmatarchaeota archaeon]